MLIPRPDGQDWYLYYEQYPGVAYGLSTSPTWDGAWHNVFWPDYSNPPKARHGCMIELGRAEWDALTASFGNP